MCRFLEESQIASVIAAGTTRDAVERVLGPPRRNRVVEGKKAYTYTYYKNVYTFRKLLYNIGHLLTAGIFSDLAETEEKKRISLEIIYDETGKLDKANELPL